MLYLFRIHDTAINHNITVFPSFFSTSFPFAIFSYHTNRKKRRNISYTIRQINAFGCVIEKGYHPQQKYSVVTFSRTYILSIPGDYQIFISIQLPYKASSTCIFAYFSFLRKLCKGYTMNIVLCLDIHPHIDIQ